MIFKFFLHNFRWDSAKSSPARYVELTQNSPQRRSIGSAISAAEPRSKVNVIHNVNSSTVSYPVNYLETMHNSSSPSRQSAGNSPLSGNINVKVKRREVAPSSPQSMNYNDVGTTKSYSDLHQTSQNNTQQKSSVTPIKHLVQTKPMSSADLDDFTPKGEFFFQYSIRL